MPSTYLSRTIGTQTLNSKFTISVWVKRVQDAQSGESHAICGTQGSGSQATQLFFDNDSLRFYDNFSSTDVITSKKFRDTNGWYHIVVAVDSSQSTAADRVKIYINGTQQTAFATANYPGQGDGLKLNISGNTFFVGTAETTGGTKYGYFNGCMTHFHFVDGQQYAASVFGETDATTGQWKANTNPTMTMGNNGFTILKDGNTITDQSSNSNNFTLGAGTLTNLQDCPNNVFATWNSLLRNNAYAGQNLPINVNSTFVSGETGTNYPTYVSTLGASSGKYYFECKMGSSGGPGAMIGVTDSSDRNSYFGSGTYDYGYFGYDGTKFVSGSATSYGNSYGNNDIVGCAVDLDNNKLYFHKNGTYQNSGVPTSGSTGTGAISIADPDSTNSGFYFFAAGDAGNSDAPTVNANFGNGYFGTTAIASEGTNASSIGKFEYDVPTGYTALSTKGLNE